MRKHHCPCHRKAALRGTPASFDSGAYADVQLKFLFVQVTTCQEAAHETSVRLCIPVFVFLFLSSLLVSAQDYLLNGELNGGYAHISGDQGLNGFNVGAALWLTHKVSIAFDYDSGWNNSRLGTFELTSVGLIVSKSQLQDLYLVGPRIFFPGLFKSKDKHIARLLPFAEAQFGISNLDSKLQEPTSGIFLHAADKEFSWMLGGGADYRFAPHWAARGKIDLLRTHFAAAGQSRVRVGLGIVYTFRER